MVIKIFIAKSIYLMDSQKVKKWLYRHAGLDQAPSDFNYFWIPACAGMTEIGLFATLLTI
ncbi:hypothetical protein [Desulforegula conservatrix]|uniref:hypothetical protein n=1 Tax=Desulforegula conservatrix TaxID=153026 RepID=UPI0003F523C3|nr:hypothetical protein [Desulforegula conservatrix]